MTRKNQTPAGTATEVLARRCARAIAALVAAAVVTTAAPALAQTGATATVQTGAEQTITRMVNEHRAGAGLPALSTHSGLLGQARKQAVRMLEAGRIYHNPNLESDTAAAVSNWRTLGENVGVGTDAAAIQNAFIRSAPHRANIENGSFNLVGIGVVSTDDGRLYVTQMFVGASVSAAATSTTKPAAGTATAAPARKAATAAPASARPAATTTARRPQAQPVASSPAAVKAAAAATKVSQEAAEQKAAFASLTETLGDNGPRINTTAPSTQVRATRSTSPSTFSRLVSALRFW
ncbi:MAG TPA: CAP domain-containing protein [Actinomycetota bacterium]|nr:CAP domain-containing protein [Actinomycetota bacterium]